MRAGLFEQTQLLQAWLEATLQHLSPTKIYSSGTAIVKVGNLLPICFPSHLVHMPTHATTETSHVAFFHRPPLPTAMQQGGTVQWQMTSAATVEWWPK